MSNPKYGRILLKLSGEVLAGDKGFGIDPKKASYLANEVKSVFDLGIEIGLIIGAGNIFRGIQAAGKGMDRVTGDYLGMLATIMNAISVQDALEKVNCETRTLSAINVSQVAEPDPPYYACRTKLIYTRSAGYLALTNCSIYLLSDKSDSISTL